jgi:hypothetical protein
MPLALNEKRARCEACLPAERKQFQHFQFCAFQEFSVAPIGSFFATFQDKKNCLTLEDGSERVSRNGDKTLLFYAGKITKEGTSHLNAAEA